MKDLGLRKRPILYFFVSQVSKQIEKLSLIAAENELNDFIEDFKKNNY